MTATGWLVLAYTLPPEPSRTRVGIWRRLRKLGAVYLDEGIWVLPNTEELSSEVRIIVSDISGFRGTASAFVSSDIDGDQGARLRQRFLAARDEEYAELQGQCQRFLVHVQHATDTKRFTFAEVEELEEELAKLERWLEEIRSRDLFGSSQDAVSTAGIDKGREALVEFTERTYTESPDAKPDPAPVNPDLGS